MLWQQAENPTDSLLLYALDGVIGMSGSKTAAISLRMIFRGGGPVVRAPFGFQCNSPRRWMNRVVGTLLVFPAIPVLPNVLPVHHFRLGKKWQA